MVHNTPVMNAHQPGLLASAREDAVRKRRRKRRSFWKRIPEKLLSRKFNFYQAVVVIVICAAAFETFNILTSKMGGVSQEARP